MDLVAFAYRPNGRFGALDQTMFEMPAKAKGRFIDPMLLLRTESLPNDRDRWECQLKLDGYRAIAFKSGGKVYCARNDNDFSVRYSAVMNGLAKLPDETAILEILPADATANQWRSDRAR